MTLWAPLRWFCRADSWHVWSHRLVLVAQIKLISCTSERSQTPLPPSGCRQQLVKSAEPAEPTSSWFRWRLLSVRIVFTKEPAGIFKINLNEQIFLLVKTVTNLIDTYHKFRGLILNRKTFANIYVWMFSWFYFLIWCFCFVCENKLKNILEKVQKCLKLDHRDSILNKEISKKNSQQKYQHCIVSLLLIYYCT